MRAVLVVVGLLLAVAGVWVGLGHGHYEHTRTAASIGPVSLETTTRETVPPAVGLGVAGVGAVLVLIGVLRKR